MQWISCPGISVSGALAQLISLVYISCAIGQLLISVIDRVAITPVIEQRMRVQVQRKHTEKHLT